MDINSLVSFVKDYSSLRTEEGRKKDGEMLSKIETMFSNNWDVVKEEKISIVSDFFEAKYVTEESDTEIKEKTILLGTDHEDEELVVRSFNFKIKGSVIKVNCATLYYKFNPNDEDIFSPGIKKSKLDINMDNVKDDVSEVKKDKWWISIPSYLRDRRTEKNEKRVQEKLTRVQGPTFKSLVDGTWTPHLEITEPDFFVNVDNLVAFGDFCDANRKTESSITPAQGSSTIRFNINTVRKFVPGVYKMSVITMKDKDEESLPFVIFHHEKVSPRKIAINLLLTSDLEFYKPGVANSLNRYDWCHAMHWGPEGEKVPTSKNEDEDCEGWWSSSEDEDFNQDLGRELERHNLGRKKQRMGEEENSNYIPPNSLFRASKMAIVYFTPITESKFFEIGVKRGFQKQSAKIKGAHQVFGSTASLATSKDLEEHSEKSRDNDANLDETEKISLGMNMKKVLPHLEWLYGAVFEDKETHLNFSLAVFPHVGDFKHFQLGIPEAFKKDTFSKEDKKFLFKMKDFEYSL